MEASAHLNSGHRASSCLQQYPAVSYSCIISSSQLLTTLTSACSTFTVPIALRPSINFPPPPLHFPFRHLTARLSASIPILGLYLHSWDNSSSRSPQATTHRYHSIFIGKTPTLPPTRSTFSPGHSYPTPCPFGKSTLGHSVTVELILFSGLRALPNRISCVRRIPGPVTALSRKIVLPPVPPLLDLYLGDLTVAKATFRSLALVVSTRSGQTGLYTPFSILASLLHLPSQTTTLLSPPRGRNIPAWLCSLCDPAILYCLPTPTVASLGILLPAALTTVSNGAWEPCKPRFAETLCISVSCQASSSRASQETRR